MTSAEFEPNTQPKRDVLRLVAMGHIVTATVTYGADGKPTHVLYAPSDTVPDTAKVFLAQFNGMINQCLAEGWSFAQIESNVMGKGVDMVVVPLIDVLRVPEG